MIKKYFVLSFIILINLTIFSTDKKIYMNLIKMNSYGHNATYFFEIKYDEKGFPIKFNTINKDITKYTYRKPYTIVKDSRNLLIIDDNNLLEYNPKVSPEKIDGKYYYIGYLISFNSNNFLSTGYVQIEKKDFNKKNSSNNYKKIQNEILTNDEGYIKSPISNYSIYYYDKADVYDYEYYDSLTFNNKKKIKKLIVKDVSGEILGIVNFKYDSNNRISQYYSDDTGDEIKVKTVKELGYYLVYKENTLFIIRVTKFIYKDGIHYSFDINKREFNKYGYLLESSILKYRIDGEVEINDVFFQSLVDEDVQKKFEPWESKKYFYAITDNETSSKFQYAFLDQSDFSEYMLNISTWYRYKYLNEQ